MRSFESLFLCILFFSGRRFEQYNVHGDQFSLGSTSFGYGKKNIALEPFIETNIFSYSVGNPSASLSAVTFFRAESAEFLWPTYDGAVVKIYVDNQPEYTVSYRLGCFDSGNTVPWGEALCGNTAAAGGVYLGLPIPFLRSIVINMTIVDIIPQLVHVQIKGIENNYQFVIGTFVLSSYLSSPNYVSNNSLIVIPRLRTNRIQNTFSPYSSIPLLSSNGTSGMLILMGIQVASTANNSYSDSPILVHIDNRAPFSIGYDLPSFFLIDDGYGTGTYNNPYQGVTSLNMLLEHGFQAWRGFQNSDLLVWNSSCELMWNLVAPSGNVTLDTTLFYYEFETVPV